MTRKNILFIFGTRPEAIKFAALIFEFQKCQSKFNLIICNTSQHKEMLQQVMDFFGLKANYDLDLMQHNQDLFTITCNGLKKLKNVIESSKPDLIFVQGDTTSAFIGALAGYYTKVKIAHLEAGLRSGNNYSPFPEEGNRKLITNITDYHFTPTRKATNNLNKENIFNNVWEVGNTVIDSLFLCLKVLKKSGKPVIFNNYETIDFTKRIILVTCHRREIFGEQFENICNSLKMISKEINNIEIVFPVHLNPYIQNTTKNILGNLPSIHLLPPLSYPELVWLMEQSYIIITDSGGIQEEAPSLGKPVLVLRNVTERTEGIEAGTAKLVGSNEEIILTELKKLINDKKHYQTMSKCINPYGDGCSCQKIVEIIKQIL